jgi:chromosome segregation ATPase
MLLTEQIYGELVDGLKTGDLDWTAFIAKHSGSKGPLYNAIGRFLHDMEPKVRTLGEVQAKLDAAGLALDSLDQKIKEAGEVIQAKNRGIVVLEDKERMLKRQAEALETSLEQKGDLLERLQELEKLGFGKEKLAVLHTTLAEIGSKRGCKGDEAVNTFFADLKDYDTKTGFEREIQRLETITDTKRLEAENWQAKAERLESQYTNLKEAIDATQALLKRGVKAEQIVSWNGIVSKLGGPEELQDKLGQYKSMSELVNARKEEAGSYELKLTKAQSQLETLEKGKTKIEAAIESLKLAGLEQVRAMTDEVMKQLKAQVAKEVKEIQAVGQSAKSQFDDYLTELNIVTERAYQLGEKIGQMGIHLEKYGAVRDILESHQAASEEVNEPIPK